MDIEQDLYKFIEAKSDGKRVIEDTLLKCYLCFQMRTKVYDNGFLNKKFIKNLN